MARRFVSRATAARVRRTPLDDVGVLAADRLELVDQLEQLGEAVRVEHDRDDVRRWRLVARPQLGGEDPVAAREAQAQLDEPCPVGAQARLEAVEDRLLHVETRLQRVLLGLEVGDRSVEPAIARASWRAAAAVAASLARAAAVRLSRLPEASAGAISDPARSAASASAATATNARSCVIAASRADATRVGAKASQDCLQIGCVQRALRRAGELEPARAESQRA